MDASREDRLREFVRRLSVETPVASFADVRRLVSETLNAVEDEMTTIPYNPENWQTDRRMYGRVLVSRPGADGRTVRTP